jgi:tetratricopeptide (TPR) repeat protein
VVWLGTDRLRVERADEVRIYDFAARTRRTVSAKEHTDDIVPLMALVDERDRGLAHQKWNAMVLEMAGDPDVMDLFDVEATIGLQLGAQPARAITENEGDGGVWTFAAESHGTVATFEGSATVLDQGKAAAFRRYLAWECSLHPYVRGRVAALARVPSRLLHRVRHPMGGIEVELSLEGAMLTPFPTDPPGVAAPAAADAGSATTGMRRMLAQVESLSPADPESRAAQVSEFVSAHESERPFDTYLALHEYAFETGVKRDEDLRRLEKEHSRDVRLQAFHEAAALMASEKAAEAVTILRGIDRRDLEKGFVMDILLANALGKTGREVEAQEAYLLALAQSPRNSGALMDLGSLQYDLGNGADAWRCWLAAHRLNPENPMFEYVAERQADLARRYADYF